MYINKKCIIKRKYLKYFLLFEILINYEKKIIIIREILDLRITC